MTFRTTAPAARLDRRMRGLVVEAMAVAGLTPAGMPLAGTAVAGAVAPAGSGADRTNRFRKMADAAEAGACY